MTELDEPFSFDKVAAIENAWCHNHSTEAPRKIAEDIAYLVGTLRAERTRHLTVEQRKDTEAAALITQRDKETERAKGFARIAQKNGNAVLAAEARIRWLEEQLDAALRWGELCQDRDVENALRSVLNDYIEDENKLHKDGP